MARVMHFFSPSIDFLMIGGLSLVAYFAVLFFGLDYEIIDIAWVMWVLAFFVNGPHFLISYQIFYRGHSKKIFESPRFFWAGVVVPVGLALAVFFGVFFESRLVFSSLLYLMFFTVGWHYVKQAYGCFVVYSAGQGVFLERWESYVVRFSLFPLWWASFLRLFVGGEKDYWGFKYEVPAYLAGWVDVLHIASFGGVIPIAFVFGRRLLRREALPSLTAILPLVVIFVWLSPFLKNDFFVYMIPFFHSLQYLLFSGSFTRGKVRESGAGFSGYLLWWGGAFVFGALVFYVFPELLDGLGIHSGEISKNLFLISFILFVNIHHYFIDNVIWRGDNPLVRKYVRMA